MQNEHHKRTMTPDAALQRLMSMCSRKEMSEGDALRKLNLWGVDPEQHKEILETLRKHNFVDNLRFAKAFASDKTKFNKWGPRKIAMALQMHHITQEAIKEVLSDTTANQPPEILEQLLIHKAKTIKANNSQDFKAKIIRFGLSRGFLYEEIKVALKKVTVNREFGENADIEPD